MKIEDLRTEIDKIDDEMAELFEKRMDIAGKVAETKKKTGKTVQDRRRENDIISRLMKNTDDEYKYYIKTFCSTLFNLSRSYQNSLITDNHELSQLINKTVEDTDKLFPDSAIVACQGMDGAYSQIAAEKLFKVPNVTFFKSFDAVFHAVEKGLCKYGVLPIENSDNGSVTQVYDLMKQRNFYIVRSISLKIDHFLLAKPGTKEGDIKTIYSHEQAIGQCSKYIESLKDVDVKVCENTAVAAKLVSESDDKNVAAISSHDCAELYGLSVINEDIQNTDNNYTRFICISKNLEVYPGSDKISIMLTVPHKPGSLFELMGMFAASGLNLTKLESRPISGRDFEFMFYFDFEASVYADDVLSLLDGLNQNLDQFKFLGSYIEK